MTYDQKIKQLEEGKNMVENFKIVNNSDGTYQIKFDAYFWDDDFDIHREKIVFSNVEIKEPPIITRVVEETFSF